MSKSLVIVESPAKAKTIRKYLGPDFDVKASVGHLLDLPPNAMGVDLDSGDFTPEYKPISGKNTVIKEIKDAAKKADHVYLAPDPDREGEAIAFHVAVLVEEACAKKKKGGPSIQRVLFHEITKKAVNKAFESPLELDTHKYDAQQARRILDRIVGYKISPILWKKVKRGLSAGRVQSVAVRLVVDREAEVLAFNPVEYWTIGAVAKGSKPPPFPVKLAKIDGGKADLADEKSTQAILDDIKKADAKIASLKKKKRQRKPTAPFITSRLQQDAARALRFTAKRTMRTAQGLYEGKDMGDEGPVGLITYMRTDSTRISNEALAEVRDYIGKNYGNEYLPKEPNVYKSKKGAQDAHEAIRPTSIERTPDSLKKYLSNDEYRLYKLIFERFVACQMTNAQFDQTTVDIEAGKHTLRATGSIQTFPGFLKVYEEKREEDDAEAIRDKEEKSLTLPDLAEGEAVDLSDVQGTQHFTQPPPRFSEASLVKELEEKGIGRPSTYASILSTIQSKSYVEKNEGRFMPTELGLIVTELLVESFPNIMDVAFTAGMEEQLDRVEEGGVNWKNALNEFYTPFKDKIAEAAVSMRDVKRMEIPTDIHCEKCEKHFVIKWGKNGSFLGCSGYPDCKTTKPYKKVDGKIVVIEPEKVDVKCDKCGAEMLLKNGRYGPFLGCSRYPECNGIQALPTGVKCPKDGCEGDVVQRRSKRGRVFFGCNKYPDCDFTSWDKPINQPCTACGHPFIIEKNTKKGRTLKCPTCGHIEESD
ncbi:MAG: DNA topoisomerase I [Myxococcales bacterium]|nr:DNA topoisomerase I [Myxococcales bacterium]